MEDQASSLENECPLLDSQEGKLGFWSDLKPDENEELQSLMTRLWVLENREGSLKTIVATLIKAAELTRSQEIIHANRIEFDTIKSSILGHEEKLNSIKDSILKAEEVLHSRQQQLASAVDSLESIGYRARNRAQFEGYWNSMHRKAQKMNENVSLGEKAYEDRNEVYEAEKRRFGERLEEFEDRKQQFQALQQKDLDSLERSHNLSKFVLDVMQLIYSQCKKKGGTGFGEIFPEISLLILEQLLQLSPCVEPEVQDHALTIANEWKGNIKVNAENSVEILGFLNFVAAFRLVSRFNRKEIYKLLKATAQHQRARNLYRDLGFTDKDPGTFTK